MDALRVIQRYTKLKQAAYTWGGEYHGACPFCGGKDRFIVWPNFHNQGVLRWTCRQCENFGIRNILTFLVRMEGITMKEAMDKAGDEYGRPLPPRVITLKPSAKWSADISWVLLDSEQMLAEEESRKARLYLTNKRKLNNRTIRHCRLGFISADYKPVIRIKLPVGICIPWFYEGVITCLNIRQPKGVEPRYYTVYGSKKTLFFLRGTGTALYIVEGEFDAMLFWQETGLSVAAAGSSSQISLALQRLCKTFEQVIVLPDNDESGRRMMQRWDKPSIAIPKGKDLTEFVAQGGNPQELIKQ